MGHVTEGSVRLGEHEPAHGFLTRHPPTRAEVQLLMQVADSDATVLITGESGTGKEVLAHAVHRHSARGGAPFVPVNCGAIAQGLQESEIFGHVAGAFTGALGRRQGYFEAADGGTIFLDEVGEMEPALQVKLLRVLQSGEYSLVGDPSARTSDVRVVSASNSNLEEAVAAGEFRNDLFYRLNVFAIRIAPLRERPCDLPLLVDHFVAALAPRYRRDVRSVDGEVLDVLERYPFPGNVRELENLVRRALILCPGPTLRLGHFPRYLADRAAGATPCGAPPADFHAAKARAVERFERDFLTRALEDSGGIVSRAAHRSGLSERNFHVKLRAYGISARAFRAVYEQPGSRA